MNTFRTRCSTYSKEITVSSLDNPVEDGIKDAIRIMSDPKFKNHDVCFSLDFGATNVEFPAGKRNPTYTVDEIWDLIQKAREAKALWHRNNPPSP